MKKLFFSILTISSIALFAQQSGKVHYKETIKLDIEIDGIEGIDIAGMIPDSQTLEKELVFKGKKSIYKSVSSDSETSEISNDEGTIQIMIMNDESEEILYCDFKEKSTTLQQDFLGKQFLISGELNKPKWKMTSERVKYLGYECMKATYTTEDDKELVAWFSPELRTPAGPSIYNQLPGLVLMVSLNDGEMEIKATKVELTEVNDKEITKPKKGKKVSEEEFVKIQEEKMKEMEMQHGGGVIKSIRIER